MCASEGNVFLRDTKERQEVFCLFMLIVGFDRIAWNVLHVCLVLKFRKENNKIYFASIPSNFYMLLTYLLTYLLIFLLNYLLTYFLT